MRTIIKAPGIPYRLNVYGTTLANARVDPRHHQISLSAKIEPSPDWILGVAGLELCLSNCTWLERKVLNLYPWDIGTDSGPSYMVSPSRSRSRSQCGALILRALLFAVERSEAGAAGCHTTHFLHISQRLSFPIL